MLALLRGCRVDFTGVLLWNVAQRHRHTLTMSKTFIESFGWQIHLNLMVRNYVAKPLQFWDYSA